ncbi:DUF29 domain-containing protein [Rhodospirillum centenum]|uniref:DUF29 domain-containing protein n=1 Tax=Rhodospirillum centenum (strain ATCC 51521 / SW) TaxID=414684 RepID=B6IMP9_RHOCS|nr:DUF29 domain-containing protein [Rhodospirillum centenum]ACI98715.1 conserved hypothetical protein [Rhodospirillum centenum SW]
MDRYLSLYGTDFYAWTQDQAARLRAAGAGRPAPGIDFEHLAEEIEDMGRGRLRALESALARIIEHLLKLDYSPASAPRRLWRASVRVHRGHARDELEDSPSLIHRVRLDRAWRQAVLLAEEGLAAQGEATVALPADCPYTLDEILDDGFLPVYRQGQTDA